MKSSKSQTHVRFYKIPELRFEDQRLTSFSGLLVFQLLFKQLDLKQRLKKCFAHLKLSSIFGQHLVVMLLIVHLLIGFRRLREVDYYCDDPLVLRLMGLRKIPDVSTISRALSVMEAQSVKNFRALSRSMVIQGLEREQFYRLTLDFDGSVLSTKRHAQGTAVGFNKTKKGARSYYPLFCTVAQTGQFFDVYHRPGNVHDSNGAARFMLDCIQKAKSELSNAVIESRMDSAFFSHEIISMLDINRIQFSASVPFERFELLKEMIESRTQWKKIDKQYSYFEMQWKPKSWNDSFRFICVRKKEKKQRKGPLQPDLFEPRSFEYDYKAVVTNKRESAKAVVLFHNGRGSQEAMFGDAKNDAALDVIPCKRLCANQIFTISAMMAHNLSHEMQMLAQPSAPRAQAKRPAAWTFEKLSTIRNRIIKKTGRLTRPQGELTLTMSANQATRNNLLHFLDVLQKAA